jgi:hypothetical protein
MAESSDIQESPQFIPKPSKNPHNPTQLDKAISMVVTSKGNLSKPEIAKEIIGMGLTKHPESVYRRLAKSDYLTAEIHTIRDHSREYLDRLMVPDALKVAHKALKNKGLTEKEKYPFIKLTLDKAMGEMHTHHGTQQVNVTAIKNAQIIIQADITDDTLSLDTPD